MNKCTQCYHDSIWRHCRQCPACKVLVRTTYYLSGADGGIPQNCDMPYPSELSHRFNLHVCINFIIEINERLLCLIIETVDANLDCFHAITPDSVCTDNVNQTTGADYFINTTVLEGLTDDVCPVSKVGAEPVRVLNNQRVSDTQKDFALDSRGRILLLKVSAKRSRNASFRTLVPMKRPSDPLPSVLQYDDVETRSRLDIATSLLQEDTLAFQHRLQTQDLVRVPDQLRLEAALLRVQSSMTGPLYKQFRH